jgi:2-hydroxychromene-2-carboxylate isomerase
MTKLNLMRAECGFAAAACGVFGVPTLFINGAMLLGHDCSDFLRRAIVTGEQEAGNRVLDVRK